MLMLLWVRPYWCWDSRFLWVRFWWNQCAGGSDTTVLF